jgi:hypothetical protein
MTPLTVNPNVTILVDEKGNLRATATNISDDLKVVVVTDPNKFKEESLGKTFVVQN